MLIYLLWTFSVRVRQFLRIWMPTNILLDVLRTRRGLRRDGTAILLGLAYLALAIACAWAVDQGRSEWLYLGFWLFLWNAAKFIIFVPVTHVQLVAARIAATRVRGRSQRAPRAYEPARNGAESVVGEQLPAVDYANVGR